MAKVEFNGTMNINNILISLKSKEDHDLAVTLLKERGNKEFDIKDFCKKNKLDYTEL